MSAEQNPLPNAQSTHLGGSASHIKIHKTGLGLMLLTWTPTPVPDEQAFSAINAAIDLVPADQQLLINSAEFYGGVGNFTANLELLARFFEKYPRAAERCFLSVKGGTAADAIHIVDGSLANLRRSVDAINSALRGTKTMDLFECARVDPNIPIEEVMQSLVVLQKEGKFGHIGVSEIGEESLKRAAKVAPVAAVEIEVSPWSYEEETKKVIAAAGELKIPIIAYSPLGRGFLTGQLKKEDLPEGDMRLRFERFSDSSYAHNQQIIAALSNIAAKHNLTPAQLSLAWVSSLGEHVVPIPGSSKPSRIRENFVGGSTKLEEEEVRAVGDAVEGVGVKGGRYYGLSKEQEFRWG